MFSKKRCSLNVISILLVFLCAHSLSLFCAEAYDVYKHYDLTQEVFLGHSNCDLGDLNRIDRHVIVDSTVLHVATRNCDTPLFIAFLCQKGASPFVKNTLGMTAMDECIINQKEQYIKAFYESGIIVQKNSPYFAMLLKQQQKSLLTTTPAKIAGLLIKMGCSPETPNEYGVRPLHECMHRCLTYFFDELFDHNADPFMTPEERQKLKSHLPLHLMPDPRNIWQPQRICIRKLKDKRRAIFLAFNKNENLYFSQLPVDVMHMASKYIE